jgi:hypothetical protein
MSLLDEAKKFGGKKKREITPEKVELALGWLSGEVGISEVAKVLKIQTMSDAYIHMATALKRGFEQGIISIKM